MSEDRTPYNSKHEGINNPGADNNKTVAELLEAVALSEKSTKEILFILDATLSGGISSDQRHDIRNHLQMITTANELLLATLSKLNNN
jgi:hypothetical protein